jgi:hypothetical protein
MCFYFSPRKTLEVRPRFFRFYLLSIFHFFSEVMCFYFSPRKTLEVRPRFFRSYLLSIFHFFSDVVCFYFSSRKTLEALLDSLCFLSHRHDTLTVLSSSLPLTFILCVLLFFRLRKILVLFLLHLFSYLPLLSLPMCFYFSLRELTKPDVILIDSFLILTDTCLLFLPST